MIFSASSSPLIEGRHETLGPASTVSYSKIDVSTRSAVDDGAAP